MSGMDSRSTPRQLFREWRQVAMPKPVPGSMAQRFADWYYAIATSRLG